VKPLARQVLGVVVLVAVLWMNGMAGAGTLSGESIGLIANRYTSYFLPAGWVFGIWSLIYLSLIAFTVYQALPGQRENAALGRLGLGWAVNGVLNIAWVVTFSFSLFGVSLLVMVALLVNLVWINEKVGAGHTELGRLDRVFVAFPFGLYLAWISVALISNTFQFATYAQWSGFGIDGAVWSAVMMAVATGLAAFMVVHRGAWVFPVVNAWAFVGIAARFPDVPVVAGTAYAMTALGFVALVAGLAWRRRRKPKG
jgi:benzodiazapine receptor